MNIAKLKFRRICIAINAIVLAVMIAASLIVLSADISYASKSLVDGQEEFFSLDEQQMRAFARLVDANYAGHDSLVQNYVFRSDEEYVAATSPGRDVRVETQIHGYEMKPYSIESFINIYSCFCEDRSEPAEITIKYRSPNGRPLTFITNRDSRVPIDEHLECCTEYRTDGDVRTVRMVMDAGSKNALSYLVFADNGINTLKLAADDADIEICSVSIVNPEKGYAVVRGLVEYPDYLDYIHPDASMTFEQTGNSIIGTKFSFDDNVISITSNHSDDIELICNTDALEINLESGLSEEEVHTELEFAAVNNKEEADRSYLALEDGEASTIYNDSYVFLGEGKTADYSMTAGSMCIDDYITVYDGEVSLNSDHIGAPSASEMIGEVFDSIPACSDMLQIRVAGNTECDYAGEMDIMLATPSEAVYVKGEGSSVSFEEYGIPNETGAFSFRLTEKFLRKASYCALDENGVICAAFNEDGELDTLAEGYARDDIAAYVLVPGVPDGTAGVEYVSVRYNDILAQNGVYAEVTYLDETREALPLMTEIYTTADSDETLEISFASQYTDEETVTGETEELQEMDGEEEQAKQIRSRMVCISTNFQNDRLDVVSAEGYTSKFASTFADTFEEDEEDITEGSGEAANDAGSKTEELLNAEGPEPTGAPEHKGITEPEHKETTEPEHEGTTEPDHEKITEPEHEEITAPESGTESADGFKENTEEKAKETQEGSDAEEQ